MPTTREPIFHDRQEATSVVPQFFTLTAFTNIAGATLTAGDLGQLSNYDIDFFPVISASSALTTVIFRSLVNGLQSGADRSVLVKTSNLDLSVPIVGFLPAVEVGDTIQIQISTDKGTVTVSQFTLQVDGIPETRLI